MPASPSFKSLETPMPGATHVSNESWLREEPHALIGQEQHVER